MQNWRKWCCLSKSSLLFLLRYAIKGKFIFRSYLQVYKLPPSLAKSVITASRQIINWPKLEPEIEKVQSKLWDSGRISRVVGKNAAKTGYQCSFPNDRKWRHGQWRSDDRAYIGCIKIGICKGPWVTSRSEFLRMQSIHRKYWYLSGDDRVWINVKWRLTVKSGLVMNRNFFLMVLYYQRLTFILPHTWRWITIINK